MFVIYSLIGFVIGIGILVFVHELGHFIMAKLSGVRVEKFSIGFPPKVFSFTYGETEYTIGATPIGGYVKMAGMIDENLDATITGEPDEFMSKNTFQKSMILLGGVIFNIGLAVFIMFVINFTIGEKKVINMPIQSFGPNHKLNEYIPDENITITKIAGKDFLYISDLRDEMLNNMDSDFSIEYLDKNGTMKSAFIPSTLHMDSAFIGNLNLVQFIPSKISISKIALDSKAEEIGLLQNDTLLSLGGINIESFNKLEIAKEVNKNKDVPLVYNRDGVIDTVMVNLQSSENGRVVLGFIPALNVKGGTLQDKVVQINYGFGESLTRAFAESYEKFIIFLKSLKQIVTLKADASKSIGGPIEMANIFGQALESGSLEIFFTVVSMISIMLALVNVLPIPGLDGGHLIIVWIEAIRGKALSIDTRMKIQKVGVSILLFIMIFAFSNDIMRHL